MTTSSTLIADYLRLLGRDAKPVLPVGEETGGVCAVLTPHPDDECMMGVLPLRLRREAGMKIIVVPITLGSAPQRKEPRRAELAASCEILGFEIAEPSARCFDQVTPDARMGQPILWEGMVGKIALLLEKLNPSIIIAPHRLDVHPTHVGVHHLLMDALGKVAPDFSPRLVFAEYYQPQTEPNFLVEAPADDAVRLIDALMCHRGEIARSPYHLRLPAWMIDSARRGEELLGGFAATAGNIVFAALYQTGQWQGGAYTSDDPMILNADRSASLWIKTQGKHGP